MQRLRQALQQVRKWLGDLLAEEQVWIADVREAVWAALQRLARLLMVAGERVAAWVAERPERMLSRPREFERSRALRFWLVRLLQVALFLPLLWVGYYLLTRETTYLEIPAYASAPQQRVLVVHNSQDIYGEEAYANAVRALDYARLQHDDLDLAAELSWPALPEYSSVLFLTELLDTIDEGLAQQLADYVANGGGLVVAYRGWNPYLAALFGMKATQDFPRMLEGEGGLTFEADFFPGVKGLKLSTKTIPDLSSFDVPLQKDVQVIARSEAGRPIVWLYRHEQGRVLYWNTVFLADKEARGFIVQSIMNAQPVGVLPVANFATLQVDDFPASISTEKIEPVATEYDMTLVEFYDKVWFPDMMDIAERYGVVYTFLIPFNYNALVEPPFNFREWEHAEVHVDDQPVFYSIYVSHLAAQKHELGLHGYNHISLSLENWPSEENMVAGLQAAWQRWDEDNLGPHPITYVPPNNIYDEAGARALTRGFPSLKILAGIYTGSFESGGDREFGPEPWNPELFDIPRITFGYNLTPRYRFALLSELGMMGIWTTFIHPDDVVHTPENYPHSPYHRNPNYWPWRGDHTGEKNGFYYRFLRWLDFVKAYYPWLRFVRTDESLDILRRHLENQVTVEMQPFGLTVHTTPDTYFQVRINDARRVFLNDLEGAQFVHVYHGGG
ncbi:MAG: DUF2194 domain-containing protein, partial [Caldilineae bacterium]